MSEIWKRAPGYDNVYVSNQGRVRAEGIGVLRQFRKQKSWCIKYDNEYINVNLLIFSAFRTVDNRS